MTCREHMQSTFDDLPAIEPERPERILTSIQAAEQLKDTLRSGRSRQVARKAPRSIAGDGASWF